jgi:hypothetical protein
VSPSISGFSGLASPAIPSLTHYIQTPVSGTAAIPEALPENSVREQARKPFHSTVDVLNHLFGAKKFGHFVSREFGPGDRKAMGKPVNAACEWLKAQYRNLSNEEKALVEETLRGAKIVQKSSLQGIRQLLRQYPVFAEKDGATKASDVLTFNGMCASMVPSAPVMTTFNWQDSLFYGMIFDPDRIAPVVAGNHDFTSQCEYRQDKVSVDRSRGPQPRYLFNGLPTANISPEGELCHEMRPVMRKMAHTIASGSEENLYFEKDKLLTHNEIVVGQTSEAWKPLCDGLFVDITSNAFVFSMAQDNHYPHLRILSKLVPIDTWIQAVQAMNVKILSGREAEFREVRQTCIENKLPFYLRMVDGEGKSQFIPVDIEKTDSIAELAREHKVRDASEHPYLVRMLEWITSELG